ncbi:hypothetical protein U0070_002675 [Myodes glareolus]|uniref:Uncharacterized protein n=1 Tax=Myodes glareolus TaxID=447135 RepID=A0AAW0HP75_MYOGA
MKDQELYVSLVFSTRVHDTRLSETNSEMSDAHDLPLEELCLPHLRVKETHELDCISGLKAMVS